MDKHDWAFAGVMSAVLIVLGLCLYLVHAEEQAKTEAFKKCLDKYAPAECAAVLK
jgi:hypothetical protein